jgi:hypothetical protein
MHLVLPTLEKCKNACALVLQHEESKVPHFHTRFMHKQLTSCTKWCAPAVLPLGAGHVAILTLSQE